MILLYKVMFCQYENKKVYGILIQVKEGMNIKNRTVDMTQGNILGQIIRFTIPIMFSGILQILYNAVDVIIVGKFSGDAALAAVGSTSPAINVMCNIFFGLTAAITVYLSQKFGAHDEKGFEKAIHTSAAMSLIVGVFMAIAGFFACGTILDWMGSPEEVRHLSTLYMRIYFLGMPSVMLFGFGSAVHRAVGDSLRPTIYAVVSGVMNVVLNLLFVIVFKMGVAGVAIATVAAQTFSAVLVMRRLIKNEGVVSFRLQKLKIVKEDAKKLILLGLPAGLQSTLISMSNVVVQTSVNKCGKDAMAASSAANSIECIVYIALYAFFETAITFTGQNYGCGNYKRIRKGFWVNMTTALAFSIVFSQLMYWTSPWLLKLYTDSDTVLALAKDRMDIVCAFYFLCVIPEVANGALRGLCAISKAVTATVVCDLGVRIVITLIGAPFKTAEDLKFLFMSFPISWILAGIVFTVLFLRKLRKKERMI